MTDNNLHNIDCFRFTKSPKETKSLPTNQLINELRLYVKKNYFHLNDQQEPITADMFQIYQVFRPTSNETIHNPPPGLTDTTRLSISQFKELNDNWFELTIESNNQDISIQQIYKQLIMPWYALAIDRDTLQITSSMSTFNRPYHRQYHSKKHISYSLRSDDEDETVKNLNNNFHICWLNMVRKFFHHHLDVVVHVMHDSPSSTWL